jgi:hypothetical protein
VVEWSDFSAYQQSRPPSKTPSGPLVTLLRESAARG